MRRPSPEISVGVYAFPVDDRLPEIVLEDSFI
jgi:hypothetical protein